MMALALALLTVQAGALCGPPMHGARGVRILAQMRGPPMHGSMMTKTGDLRGSPTRGTARGRASGTARGVTIMMAHAAPLGPQMRGPSRFFLDTADVAEWENLMPLGIFHGITTNPVLLEHAGVPCTVPACHRLADQAFALGAQDLMLQVYVYL